MCVYEGGQGKVGGEMCCKVVITCACIRVFPGVRGVVVCTRALPGESQPLHRGSGVLLVVCCEGNAN